MIKRQGDLKRFRGDERVNRSVLNHITAELEGIFNSWVKASLPNLLVRYVVNTWRTDEKISFPMSSNYSTGFLLPAFLPKAHFSFSVGWKR